jgi:hypothetical protein
MKPVQVGVAGSTGVPNTHGNSAIIPLDKLQAPFAVVGAGEAESDFKISKLWRLTTLADPARRMSEMKRLIFVFLCLLGLGTFPAHAQCSGVFAANTYCGTGASGGSPGPISIPWGGPQLHQSASPPGFPSTFNSNGHNLLWADLNDSLLVDWFAIGSHDPSQIYTWQVGGSVNASGNYNACLRPGLQFPVSTGTSTGGTVLNYGSTPAWISQALTAGIAITVTDPLHPGAIPPNTIISSATGTTVTLSANVAAPGVGANDPVNYTIPVCYTHYPTDSTNSIAGAIANTLRGISGSNVSGPGVTVASGGSGCTNSPQTFTVVGGTLAFSGGNGGGAATVTATPSGGSISAVTFQNPGLYSALPASPATLSGGGCSIAPTINFTGTNNSATAAVVLAMTTQYKGSDGFGFWSAAYDTGALSPGVYGIGFDWPWSAYAGNAIGASIQSGSTVTISYPAGSGSTTLLGQQVATNNATAAGNNTLHFPATPSTVVAGELVVDITTPSAIPAGTTVSSTTGTTVVMSANAAGSGVGNGDYIAFSVSIGLDNDPIFAASRTVYDPTSAAGRPAASGDVAFNMQLSGQDALGNLVNAGSILTQFLSGSGSAALYTLALGAPSSVSGSNNPPQLYIGSGLQTNTGSNGNECGAFPGDGNFLVCGFVQANGSVNTPTVNGGSAPNSTLVLNSTSNASPSGDAVAIHGSTITLRALGGASQVNIGLGATSAGSLVLASSSTGTATISAGSMTTNGTYILPSVSTSDTFTMNAATQTLTNKTLASPILTTPVLGVASGTSLTLANGTGNGLKFLGLSGAADGQLAEVNNLFLVAPNDSAAACYPNCAAMITDHALNAILGVVNGGASPTQATDYVFIDSTLAASGTGAGSAAFTVAGGVGIVKSLYVGGSYVAAGSVPTASGTCSVAGQTGGNTAGALTASGACMSGTYILTFANAAPNGWACDASDRTTTADTVKQTASSTTTATFTATTANNDVVSFKCTAY